LKNNYTRIVTGVGVSQYAWLTSPDTRFDEVGHYKTNLILSGQEAEDLKSKIDAEITKSVALAKEKAKGKNVKQSVTPYEDDTDDTGKATGKTIFKFKTKAQITTKDGKLIPNRVAIFDAKGTPMIDTNIWSGSEMKVSAELVPYYTAMVGAGVSMRLRAVQITKLVEGGNANAKGYGFDEEEGYEHSASDTPADVEESQQAFDF
tara:strand:+ start:6863 stop:7477 length:615 start_codon:yes stop_codon:yes gene_type:complete